MAQTEQQDTKQAELIILAKSGDLDAFSELMERLQPRLLAQAVSFCGDPESAKDLVQDAMIAAWKSLGRFDGSCQPFTWLYVILQRQHLRSLGWFARRIPLATSAQALTASRHEDAANDGHSIGSDESRQLRSMVSALPRKHREVIRLRFYAEASEQETAAALGISVGTVKSRLYHAMEKLRRMREKLNLLRPEPHLPTDRA